ncbi:MAG TPA: GNAT family N-acetyltransferase [Mycobacteriales bacterium]|nr:GNAT family N-acetyltransferase [Mycobacteriales bacterium]
MSSVVIREATPEDVPAIIGLIRDLADYEKSLDQVQITDAQLHAALFGDDAVAGCYLAEDGGPPLGMALWFRTYSTWTGEIGLYLEDLFVQPQHRGGGHGRALLARLAKHCVDNGWPRFEWAVLDWNLPAIGFYESLGAKPMDRWTTYRVTGLDLVRLARSAAG